MVLPPEGKRRAVQAASGLGPASSADLATMWGFVAQAQAVLGKRRSYYLASEAEVRLGDQLSLVGLLQDWVPVSLEEAGELVRALRAYIGADLENPRDRHADALDLCIRAMTQSRARSDTPYPAGD